MGVCISLTMLAACRYLTQVSLLLIGQQDQVDFFRYWPFLPHWLAKCANFMPTPGKKTNTALTTLSASAIQAASQSTFINEQIYSTCD